MIGEGGPGADMAVTRLNSDGSVDTSFATSGKELVDFGGAETARGLAIQADGKLGSREPRTLSAKATWPSRGRTTTSRSWASSKRGAVSVDALSLEGTRGPARTARLAAVRARRR